MLLESATSTVENHQAVTSAEEVPQMPDEISIEDRGAYSLRTREQVLADVALIERFGGNRQLAQLAFQACSRRLDNLGLRSAL